FLKDKKWRDIILASVFFSLQVLSSFYIGYMLSIGLLVFFVFYCWKTRENILSNKFLLKLITGFLICLVFVGPFAYVYYTTTKKYQFRHYLGEVVQYSANLDDYIQARQTNLLFGKLRYDTPVGELPFEERLFNFLRAKMGSKVGSLGAEKLPGESLEEKLYFERFSKVINRPSNEKNVFLGILPFIIAVLGFIYSKRLENTCKKNLIVIFFFLMMFFLVLSFGPFLIVLGHFTYIPLPYLFFYYILPAFNVMRAPARFAYMVIFFISVLSGFGILFVRDYLNAKDMKSPFLWKGIVYSLILIVLTVEFLTIPVKMEYIRTGKHIPEIYKWLGKQEISGGVAEIPTIRGTLSKYDPKYGKRKSEMVDRENLYWYYSCYHLKPITNGIGSFYPDSYFKITRSLNNIVSPESVKLLKNYNVSLFILHKDKFDDEDRLNWTEENIEKAGLEKVIEFGTDVVLKWKK
ncbi:hypothetical protein DRQ09_08190, partial [candidate division KSB1 bacterium]